jgi:deoxyribodipyrimidine photo-lyase
MCFWDFLKYTHLMETANNRVTTLRDSPMSGECVLYVMSRDQRVGYNHALMAAQVYAINQKLPLCVVFCLYNKAGKRAREHFEFMIDGLHEVEKSLAVVGIPFMMVIGDPFEVLSSVFVHTRPRAVYFDFSPLRGPMKLQQRLAKSYDASFYQVDTHNIVPVKVVSEKAEYGAYTLRPKIHKLLATYLVEPDKPVYHPYAWPGKVLALVDLQESIKKVLDSLPANGSKPRFNSGEKAAKSMLQSFVQDKLERYAVDRNHPESDHQSDLSPYLHFGQISALEIAIELRGVSIQNGADLHYLTSPKMPQPEDAIATSQYGIDSLIEEMIVRKELADNFCLYTPNYDTIECAPTWAKTTLQTHANDVREYIYSLDELRAGETRDPAWNAAQKQMTTTGKMHGYMRMYWAKKILEWTESAEVAIETAVYLNDFYSLDGGDPNGYAGIMWAMCGVHDRPWNEREIFGTVRYMNYGGLKRKFDIVAYEKQWI